MTLYKSALEECYNSSYFDQQLFGITSKYLGVYDVKNFSFVLASGLKKEEIEVESQVSKIFQGYKQEYQQYQEKMKLLDVPEHWVQALCHLSDKLEDFSKTEKILEKDAEGQLISRENETRNFLARYRQLDDRMKRIFSSFLKDVFEKVDYYRTQIAYLNLESSFFYWKKLVSWVMKHQRVSEKIISTYPYAKIKLPPEMMDNPVCIFTHKIYPYATKGALINMGIYIRLQHQTSKEFIGFELRYCGGNWLFQDMATLEKSCDFLSVEVPKTAVGSFLFFIAHSGPLFEKVMVDTPLIKAIYKLIEKGKQGKWVIA